MAEPCSPKNGPVPFTVLKNFFVWMICSWLKFSSLRLGRAPQHPLSRPSSFRGVEKIFRRDIMQIVNNVQINGWSCSRKHSPAHFTVSKTFSRLDGVKLFKTTRSCGWPCSPKHDPVLFTVLKSCFVWMLCSHLKPFKLMAGPRSPTSPVTAHLISRRWRVFSFYADCQQRSNQRRVVLPQTLSSSFHGVKNISRLDGMKLFKNVRIYGWAVLPQTRPSFFWRCWKDFSFDVMRIVNNVQLNSWSCSPKHGSAHFTVLKHLLSGWDEAFQKRSFFRLGRFFFSTVQCFSRCWKTFPSG